MARFRISPAAEQDIEALLVQGILDLADDPSRAGSLERSELAKGAKTYHLRHSRDHVGRTIGRIRKPRHFLLYRMAADGCLEIGRVLHDSMDLVRHLPPDYQSVGSEPEE